MSARVARRPRFRAWVHGLSSSVPASAVSAPRTRCARPASTTSRSSSARTPSAASGATTPTRARPATCRPRSTPGPGPPTPSWGRRYSAQPEILDYIAPHGRHHRAARPGPDRGRGAGDGVRRALLAGRPPTAGRSRRTWSSPRSASSPSPVVPATPGRRHLRRAGLPLRPVAPRRRPHRQAGRRRRHRSERDPARAGHRRPGRLADGVPALGAVRRPEAGPRLLRVPPPALPPLAAGAGGERRCDLRADRAVQRGRSRAPRR